MKPVVFAIALLVACGGDDVVDLPDQTTFGGVRPAELLVPAAYDGEALPFIIVLHGHSATGAVQLGYSRIGRLVDKQAVFVMAPDGLVNDLGNQYWNATDACCDFFDTNVDDSAYIRGLIDEVSSVYNIDPKQIFLWGHSNGGFMSYRMACDHADVIAGIVSLAGATHLDPAACNPSEPVNVLQIHGDQDSTVLFDGGADCVGFDCTYPGAPETISQWAIFDGCSDTRTIDSVRLDLLIGIGEETRIEHQDGCPAGIGVDLWVIEGGNHIPNIRDDFDDRMWEWMSAHPKP